MKSLLYVVSSACFLVLLSGCGSSSDVEINVGDPAPAERAQWALPLDAYIMSDANYTITNYAENLLVEACMNEANLDWAIPHVQVEELKQPTRSPSGRKILNEEIAAVFGYQEPHILPAEVRAAELELNSKTLESHVQSQVDQCIVQAREKMPLPEYNQLGSNLANQAYVTAAADSTVIEAASKWRTCMQPRGIADLPVAPEGNPDGSMPSPSMIGQFDMANRERVVSSAEIAIALADAECRTSSGFSDAMYAVERKLQSESLADHADELVRDKEEIQKYLEAAEQVIIDHAGN